MFELDASQVHPPSLLEEMLKTEHPRQYQILITSCFKYVWSSTPKTTLWDQKVVGYIDLDKLREERKRKEKPEEAAKPQEDREP